MTAPRFTPDRALLDRNLLGATLGDIAPWSTWLAVLRASFGLPLSEEQRAIFHAVAGDRSPPSKRVRELWAIVGRRGGKSRMAAALSVYISCFVKHKLAAGEAGHVIVLAASRDQAQVVFTYIRAFLEDSPVLKQEIENVTANEIRLRNGVVIGTHANSFRSIRGRTIVACIFDEVALWRDETSAVPDLEVYRAVTPSLLAAKGMMIGISTPYRKVGLLHQKWRDHWGVDGDDVLVIQGPSTAFNPTLSQSEIDASIADDPDGATSEWQATFRTDIASFLDDATVDAAIDHDRPLELPPRAHSYVAFCDPSGGRHDAFTIAIAHEEGESVVVDLVRGTKPPFDPMGVVTLYTKLLQDYGIHEVHGDGYAEAWVEQAWADCGIAYERSELKKSELYLEALPLFTRGAISLPDHQLLLRELRLLERQAHRGGRETIDHPKRGTDDYANSVAGVAATIKADTYDPVGPWIDGTPSRPPEDVKKREERVLRMQARPFWGMPVVGSG
jgi:Terminase large subunit, ATPase domain